MSEAAQKIEEESVEAPEVIVDEVAENEEVASEPDQEAPEDTEYLSIEVDGEKVNEDDEGDVPQSESKNMNRIRNYSKKLKKKNKSLEDKLAYFENQLSAANPSSRQARVEPKLEDFYGEEDKFKAAYKAFVKEEEVLQSEINAEQDAAKLRDEKYQAKHSRFEESEKVDNIEGYDEAKHNAFEALDDNKKGIIVSRSKDPKILFSVIGNNPELAEKFKKLDYDEFIWDVAQLEKGIKTKVRSRGPAPDTPQSGGSGGTLNTTLARLEKEAWLSRDVTALNKYKRELATKNGG